MTEEEDNERKKGRSSAPEDQTIIGIRVISSIASKILASVATPDQIFSAIKQILFFYKLLPAKWKKNAYSIFEKLWSKKQVIISTNPEEPQKIYEISFDDDRLNKLIENLPEIDRSIITLGKSMIDLINKGLHSESDRIKIDVDIRYGSRGLNIVNMLTTGDIQYPLEEIEKVTVKETVIKIFNYWAYNYDSIALLVSPIELDRPTDVQKKIIELATRNLKEYILINLSGKLEDTYKLVETVEKLKKEGKLSYKEFKQEINDSGFCKAMRGKIIFK